ncbi:auxin efflux carrier component 5-like [Sesamum indicum]|uniref:Auxin efflux carrier component n=1 Tax=Sesamum indicum TaxID=4182 RepID=A0A6I9T2L7_SESIN|nr:auxin efflux carrier component 5-like [Sesamum indicum]
MIGWGDVYKVVACMAPLYVALALGYGSVKWWRMFKPDQCDAINRFNCYFIIPFFTFHFTAGVDPYHMNYRFLAADVIAKAIAGSVLALWANLCRKGDLSWAITSFSLSSLNNTLVVGVPLLEAMYGPVGQDLVVQSSVLQSLLWFPILLFLLQFWRTSRLIYNNAAAAAANTNNSTNTSIHNYGPTSTQNCSNIEIVVQQQGATPDATNYSDHQLLQQVPPKDPNYNSNTPPAPVINVIGTTTKESGKSASSNNLGPTMKKVCAKLGKNPNCYACAIGLIWALLAKRWDFEMPSIVDGSVMIMAKAGSGVAMFTMGLFMALQEKVIACGVRLTVYGMFLRFVSGPLTVAVGSLALGLRSNVLRIAVIQAALPQAIASFVFAQEYGLHANVLSTAVIFGTIISLPLLIAYYVVLDVVH